MRSKAKKWVRKILREDVSRITPVPRATFTHESDEKTLAALKKIPFFDKICNKFIAWFNEPVFKVKDMSTKIMITENQIPMIYTMVKHISAKLGIEMPKLFLELDRSPNAYTYGNESPTITVTSGLLECMEEDELYAVLAHECGHIACNHVLYHTMGAMILDGGVFGISLLDDTGWITQAVSLPLKIAFYHWMRCSEFSADRAATLCCGTPDPVIESMMRLAGGTTHLGFEIDKDLFLDQARSFDEIVEDSKLNKAIELLMIHDQAHPLLTVRAGESLKWASSEEFREAMDAMRRPAT